ncbi:hypothetical protein J4558_27560 [Leptolyngbya sp. 15MV]|nr:hypothetical protein J4558_27560 [Leptolyngbya sp. 15MV]
MIALAPDTDGVRQHVLLDRGTQAAGAWTLDTTTGAWTRYYTEAPSSGPTTLRLLTMGRLGDVYVLDGRSLRRFDARVQPPVQVGLYVTPGPVVAMTYDDKADRVVMLSTQPASGPRQVYSISRLMGDLQTWDLPVTINGDAWIQEDPVAPQSYWVMGSQTGILRRVQVAVGGGMVLAESAGLFLNPDLSDLNVVDGPRLIFANNGQLIELEKNSAGSWVNRPGSRWAGRTVSGPLHVARSRSDLDPVREVGPSFDNTLSPVVFPQLGGAGADPDCWANCDGSTTTPKLSPADFVCFLNLYRQGTTGSLIAQWSSYANCDQSTGTPVLSPADFVCFLNKYRARQQQGSKGAGAELLV